MSSSGSNLNAPDALIASTMSTAAVAEIVLILYITMKEIFKKTGDSYVLKD